MSSLIIRVIKGLKEGLIRSIDVAIKEGKLLNAKIPDTITLRNILKSFRAELWAVLLYCCIAVCWSQPAV